MNIRVLLIVLMWAGSVNASWLNPFGAGGRQPSVKEQVATLEAQIRAQIAAKEATLKNKRAELGQPTDLTGSPAKSRNKRLNREITELETEIASLKAKLPQPARWGSSLWSAASRAKDLAVQGAGAAANAAKAVIDLPSQAFQYAGVELGTPPRGATSSSAHVGDGDNDSELDAQAGEGAGDGAGSGDGTFFQEADVGSAAVYADAAPVDLASQTVLVTSAVVEPTEHVMSAPVAAVAPTTQPAPLFRSPAAHPRANRVAAMGGGSRALSAQASAMPMVAAPSPRAASPEPSMSITPDASGAVVAPASTALVPVDPQASRHYRMNSAVQGRDPWLQSLLSGNRPAVPATALRRPLALVDAGDAEAVEAGSLEPRAEVVNDPSVTITRVASRRASRQSDHLPLLEENPDDDDAATSNAVARPPLLLTDAPREMAVAPITADETGEVARSDGDDSAVTSDEVVAAAPSSAAVSPSMVSPAPGSSVSPEGPVERVVTHTAASAGGQSTMSRIRWVTNPLRQAASAASRVSPQAGGGGVGDDGEDVRPHGDGRASGAIAAQDAEQIPAPDEATAAANASSSDGVVVSAVPSDSVIAGGDGAGTAPSSAVALEEPTPVVAHAPQVSTSSQGPATATLVDAPSVTAPAPVPALAQTSSVASRRTSGQTQPITAVPAPRSDLPVGRVFATASVSSVSQNSLSAREQLQPTPQPALQSVPAVAAQMPTVVSAPQGAPVAVQQEVVMVPPPALVRTSSSSFVTGRAAQRAEEVEAALGSSGSGDGATPEHAVQSAEGDGQGSDSNQGVLTEIDFAATLSRPGTPVVEPEKAVGANPGVTQPTRATSPSVGKKQALGLLVALAAGGSLWKARDWSKKFDALSDAEIDELGMPWMKKMTLKVLRGARKGGRSWFGLKNLFSRKKEPVVMPDQPQTHSVPEVPAAQPFYRRWMGKLFNRGTQQSVAVGA